MKGVNRMIIKKIYRRSGKGGTSSTGTKGGGTSSTGTKGGGKGSKGMKGGGK